MTSLNKIDTEGSTKLYLKLMFPFLRSDKENDAIRKQAQQMISAANKPEPKLKSVGVRTATRKLPQNKKSGGKVYSRGSRKAKYNG